MTIDCGYLTVKKIFCNFFVIFFKVNNLYYINNSIRNVYVLNKWCHGPIEPPEYCLSINKPMNKNVTKFYNTVG